MQNMAMAKDRTKGLPQTQTKTQKFIESVENYTFVNIFYSIFDFYLGYALDEISNSSTNSKLKTPQNIFQHALSGDLAQSSF